MFVSVSVPTHSHVCVCAQESYAAMFVPMGEREHAHGHTCGFMHACVDVCEEMCLCAYVYTSVCVHA